MKECFMPGLHVCGESISPEMVLYLGIAFVWIVATVATLLAIRDWKRYRRRNSCTKCGSLMHPVGGDLKFWECPNCQSLRFWT